MAQTHYKISEVSALTGLSADTLRYYERIGLLHNVPRTAGGARRYTEQNLVSLRFVQRAQKMNFSLAEIGQLAEMREAPAQACQEVEEIARIKLQEIARHIHELRLNYKPWSVNAPPLTVKVVPFSKVWKKPPYPPETPDFHAAVSSSHDCPCVWQNH